MDDANEPMDQPWPDEERGCGCGELYAALLGIEKKCHDVMDPELPGDRPVTVRYVPMRLHGAARDAGACRGLWSRVVVREDCAQMFSQAQPRWVEIEEGIDAAGQ
jgi:hypothetical protein